MRRPPPGPGEVERGEPQWRKHRPQMSLSGLLPYPQTTWPNPATKVIDISLTAAWHHQQHHHLRTCHIYSTGHVAARHQNRSAGGSILPDTIGGGVDIRGEGGRGRLGGEGPSSPTIRPAPVERSGEGAPHLGGGWPAAQCRSGACCRRLTVQPGAWEQSTTPGGGRAAINCRRTDPGPVTATPLPPETEEKGGRSRS